MFSIFQAKTVHFFSISNQNSQNLYPIYEKKNPAKNHTKACSESLSFWELQNEILCFSFSTNIGLLLKANSRTNY